MSRNALRALPNISFHDPIARALPAQPSNQVGTRCRAFPNIRPIPKPLTSLRAFRPVQHPDDLLEERVLARIREQRWRRLPQRPRAAVQ